MQRNSRFCTFYAIAHLFELNHSVECNPLQLVAKGFIKLYGRVFNRALSPREAGKALEGRRIQCRKPKVQDIIFKGLKEYEFTHKSAQAHFPCIAILSESHAVVLTSSTKTHYKIIDSISGERNVEKRHFDKAQYFYTLKV